MSSLPLFIAMGSLAVIAIVEVGLVSSMVGFLYDQRHHIDAYQIDWPGGTVFLPTMPQGLIGDHGHTTNGAAGYGFVVGVFGLFVAWRQRRGGRLTQILLNTLTVLLLLSTLLTLAAFIYVFVVTYQTDDQPILERVARAASATNTKYPLDDWTPENWYKSLRDLPLGPETEDLRSKWNDNIRRMMTWRWWLIPFFLADAVALGVAAWATLRERRASRFATSGRVGEK